MPKQEKSTLTSRLFTCSLKPVWDKKRIDSFLSTMTGIANVWIINHDKDTNTEGEVIEAHTHLLLEYDTPRKITTIANLVMVEANFVEVGRSKKALLRYLTHKDDKDKFQYADDEVFTNTDVPYADQVFANNLSDKEIAEYIRDGRGYDLLGLVPVSKLRTIQAFLQFDRSGQILNQLREVGAKVEEMSDKLGTIEKMALDLVGGATRTMEQMTNGIIRIAEEAKLARLKAQARR